MDILEKIDLMLGEMDGGDMATPGTTTSKVTKIPMGTKKTYKRDEEEDELEKKQKKDIDTIGEL